MKFFSAASVKLFSSIIDTKYRICFKSNSIPHFLLFCPPCICLICAVTKILQSYFKAALRLFGIPLGPLMA